MKNIYLLNNSSRAAAYGIGTYIRQMIHCFSGMADVSLHLVQFHSAVKRFERIQQKGYEEWKIPSPCLPDGKRGKRYYSHVGYLLLSEIQVADKDEVYFLMNYTSQSFLIPTLRERYPNCRIFLTVHYQEWCFALKGNVCELKNILSVANQNLLDEEQAKVYDAFQREQTAYGQVDKVICLSHFTEEVLWNIYDIPEDKTTVIYNGLKDDAIICTPEERMQIKKALGFCPEEKIILFVGRLDPIKGVKLLIRAFCQLQKEEINCRLVLIGDGNFSEYLKECDRYWHQITFTGRLEKERLHQFYQIADVGVLPSMHEQCSYTAIEMMMFDIPLIASTTTGLKEMIQENRNGCLFEMKDEENVRGVNLLVAQLKYVLEKEKDKKRFHPRWAYWDCYSLERMKERWLNELKWI